MSVFGVFLVRKCGEIPRISPHSVQMWENTYQKTPNTDTFHAVILMSEESNQVENIDSEISDTKNLLACGKAPFNHIIIAQK